MILTPCPYDPITGTLYNYIHGVDYTLPTGQVVRP